MNVDANQTEERLCESFDPGGRIRRDLEEFRPEGMSELVLASLAGCRLLIAGPVDRLVTVYAPRTVHVTFLRAQHMRPLKQAAARHLGLPEADFALRLVPFAPAGGGGGVGYAL